MTCGEVMRAVESNRMQSGTTPTITPRSLLGSGDSDAVELYHNVQTEIGRKSEVPSTYFRGGDGAQPSDHVAAPLHPLPPGCNEDDQWVLNHIFGIATHHTVPGGIFLANRGPANHHTWEARRAFRAIVVDADVRQWSWQRAISAKLDASTTSRVQWLDVDAEDSELPRHEVAGAEQRRREGSIRHAWNDLQSLRARFGSALQGSNLMYLIRRHYMHQLLLDDGFLDEWDPGLIPNDPLHFSDGKPYRVRAEASRKSAGSAEAIEIGRASINSIRIGYGSFLFSFMGGSMGSVVGEKITRLFENATEERMPVVLLQSSGGARMQEGILSLMQMAKTVSALERLRSAGLPFISVLLHPTTGGVAASFAFLGDLNIAEPNALIGFAGPRVIESTIRQTLPEGFQKTEFLLKHGMIDRVVSRRDMKQELSTILGHLLGGTKNTK